MSVSKTSQSSIGSQINEICLILKSMADVTQNQYIDQIYRSHSNNGKGLHTVIEKCI